MWYDGIGGNKKPRHFASDALIEWPFTTLALWINCNKEHEIVGDLKRSGTKPPPPPC